GNLTDHVQPFREDNVKALFGADHWNQPMLIDNVELVKHPKDTTSAQSANRLPSLVWLHPLDHCLIWLAHAVQRRRGLVSEFAAPESLNSNYPPVPDFFPVSSSIQDDRERRIICRCFSESVDQAIKGGTEIVRDLTDINTPVRVGFTAYANAVYVLSRLTIELRPDGAVVGVLPKGVLGESESMDFTFCTP
ncbi:MAG: hypothetical protein IIC32_05075, partial [Chloroflexi bacterium]|nr:hypothetical protein [Chloroflexota bacterium]